MRFSCFGCYSIGNLTLFKITSSKSDRLHILEYFVSYSVTVARISDFLPKIAAILALASRHWHAY
ncbi:hypothetical protein H1P_3100005 [Hyella patelloides LEGE 07179]|uniref:Uncharacterized protein n=1 Tax=Hyella patelloides LEGE 07179 TaxID=945734 RepID=A0A563VUT2_9CYAN|nr:hypothetical protein H1P_3100005 [Hyella patelloides LEGE 07179]